MNWQVITPAQAQELHLLKVNENPTFLWKWIEDTKTWELVLLDDCKVNSDKIEIYLCAYTLAEIAVMLGYIFVASNVKEAAERLINELKIETMTAKDCNARLKEVQDAV